MVSEEERLKRELEEARAALRYKEHEMKYGMEKMFELETEIQLGGHGYLRHMNPDALEERIERLERDLNHLEAGTWD